jgi:hypothetical protein
LSLPPTELHAASVSAHAIGDQAALDDLIELPPSDRAITVYSHHGLEQALSRLAEGNFGLRRFRRREPARSAIGY